VLNWLGSSSRISHQALHPLGSNETISLSDETISAAREVYRQRSPVRITTVDQTTGFGHVGVHNQLSLRPVLQEISRRHGKARAPVDLKQKRRTDSNAPCGLLQRFSPAGNVRVKFRLGVVGQMPLPRFGGSNQSRHMRLMPIALILFVATGAMSADQVMIAGIGTRSCAYWTSTPPLKSEGEKWALGFWSALNYVAAVTKTQNQLIIDPDNMLAEIEKMCSQRPSQSLADSVWITFLTLNKSQQ
jgi:hypothetical protein